MKSDKKVLVHTCCAVCSAHPLTYLKELGYEPIAYFFNPNIYTQEEHDKRLDSQIKLCKVVNCELIVENHDLELYDEVMQGYETYPEGSARCKRCFELRLLKTVQKAQELGIQSYTTTLSVSPHKNFDILKNVGEHFAAYFGISFLDYNFKKQDGFLKSNRIANELKLYKQDFCGCSISLERNNSFN